MLLSLLTRLADASAPLRLDEPDFHHINKIFDELGPVPRLCIDYNERELLNLSHMELSNLTIKSLQVEHMVCAGRSLAIDAISHKICLVRRLTPTDLDLSFEIEVLPITAIIGSRIIDHL